jgi:hypothetical protein
MKPFLLVLHLFFYLFCLNSVSYAQETDKLQPDISVTDTVSIDTEDYDEDEEEEFSVDTLLSSNLIFYNRDSLRQLKDDKDLKYIQKLDTLLEQWQNEQTRKKPTNNNWVYFIQFIKFLLWLLVIGGVIFLIYRLFLSEKGLFSASVRKKQLLQEENDITDEETLTSRIKEAEKTGQYRMAVRYSYLRALHSISDKGWLHLSPDKTNYQYLRELNNKTIRNDFARITLHYEYAWYGNFEVDAMIYQTIKKEFETFQLKMRS